MWNAMITETRMLPTPAMTDASDLVLRMGRLVWDDPQWTPAHSRRASPRDPAALAPGTDAVVTVVAAVHHSVDALARLAEADMHAVETAERSGRLYVPTRSLSEDYDVPRPFATAPVARCQALHQAYRVALDASVRAARALDELSLAASAPSKALALARTAAPAQSRRRGIRPRPDDGIAGDAPLPGTPFRHSRAGSARRPEFPRLPDRNASSRAVTGHGQACRRLGQPRPAPDSLTAEVLRCRRRRAAHWARRPCARWPAR